MGGGNLWVQKILDEISFDEEFIGLGYFEDIDFSFRVSKKNLFLLLWPSRLFMKTFWPCKTDQVVDLAGSGLLSFCYEESDC